MLALSHTDPVKPQVQLQLEIIFDLPFGFPINNIISLCSGCGRGGCSSSRQKFSKLCSLLNFLHEITLGLTCEKFNLQRRWHN